MEIRNLFRAFCLENELNIQLQFGMPPGFEDAYGEFEPVSGVLYYNYAILSKRPECEQVFYLYHELRHAMQHLKSSEFSPLITRSLRYVIMFDGTCYRRAGDQWQECRLEGSEEYFTQVYLSQPYERDANRFAYEQTLKLLGDSPELSELYAFWKPHTAVTDDEFRELYKQIEQAAW